jgi:hypothetical protein
MKFPRIPKAWRIRIDIRYTQYPHFEPREAIFVEEAKKIIARSPTSYDSYTERNVYLLSPANPCRFNGLVCLEESLVQWLTTSVVHL